MSIAILEKCHVAHSSFAERFGYACWLYYLREGRAPAYAAIGRAVGRTGEAVGFWGSAKEPPSDFRVHGPAAEFLGIDEHWLFREEGDPPRPELWKEWLTARRPRGAKLERPDIPAPRPSAKRVAEPKPKRA